MSVLTETRFEERQFEKAAEFLKALLPVGGIIDELDGDPGRKSEIYYFRGHRSSDWDLIPTSLRADTELLLRERDGVRVWKRSGDLRESKRIEAEAYLLLWFVQFCDENGLHIPEDGQVFRHTVQDFIGYESNVNRNGGYRKHRRRLPAWPPRETLSALGLAQHHGLPTRLLDFTLDPMVAAYFASQPARVGDESCTCERIAVWCVPAIAVNELYRRGTLLSERKVQVVFCPAAGNSNLKAQSGCFLLNPVDLSEVEENPASLLNVLANPADRVLKLTLPRSERDELLDFLRKYGYSKHRLLLNFRGCVEGIYEDKTLIEAFARRGVRSEA